MKDNNNGLVKVFLGDLPNETNKFKVSNFENAHLKGFLRGYDKFRFGFHTTTGEPMYFSVKFKLMTREDYYKFLNIK